MISWKKWGVKILPDKKSVWLWHSLLSPFFSLFEIVYPIHPLWHWGFWQISSFEMRRSLGLTQHHLTLKYEAWKETEHEEKWLHRVEFCSYNSCNAYLTFVAFLRRLYYSVTHNQWCPFGLLWGRYAYWDPITLVVQYLVCSEPHWTTTSCPVSLTRQLVFHRARQLKC